MKAQAAFVLLLAAWVAAGCGAPPGTSSNYSAAAPDLTGNWQIQPSVIAPAVPPSGVLLLGALESSGWHVSGTFRFSNLGQPATCGLDQVVTLNGAIDANDKLTLTSAALPNGTTINVALQISGSQTYSGTGTIEVDGTTCAFANAPALGMEIASLSGSYSGALTPGSLGSPAPGTPGTASLTLTQSASPGSDGQFAASGTFTYQFGSCSGSVALTGTVSGVGVILSAASTNSQTVAWVGFADSAASGITTTLIFAPAPCSADPASNAIYSGKLNRQ